VKRKSGVAFIILGVMWLLGFFVWTTVAGANPPPPNSNQVEYWCPNGGVKYEPVDTPFTVPPPPEGFTWTLLVLKAGNEETSVETENETFPNPVVGQEYSRTDGKNISHVILCHGPLVTTTGATTTGATTTLATTTTAATTTLATTTTAATTTLATTTTAATTTQPTTTIATTTTAPTTTGATTTAATTTQPTTTVVNTTQETTTVATTAPTTTGATTTATPVTPAPPQAAAVVTQAPPTTAPTSLPVTGFPTIPVVGIGLGSIALGEYLRRFAR
jgi:hypothetical protein